MIEILKDILSYLPDKNIITNSGFEGANIVLYTKDKEFLIDNSGIIKEIVNNIKKRIELRADNSILLDMEDAEEKIRQLVPKEANLSNILFDPQRSIVTLEAEKPGLAIGKQGEVLRNIKKETMWTTIVQRTPAIRSKLIENIRQVLYENNDYRKKFLNKIGEEIYSNGSRKVDWIRVSFLGGARQVGRSCILLQTPRSKVLLDCGVNIATTEDHAYPYLDAPEFDINEIDAVVLSHAHLDHSGFVPYLYKYGYKGPVYCTAPTRDISSLLLLDYIGVSFKEAKKAIFSSSDIKEMVKHTITLNYEEVTDITSDIRLTLYNAGHTLGSAMCHLHIGNGLHNFLYTADIKYGKTQLLESAVVQFPRLETVLIESTNGAKTDILPPREEAENSLIEAIKKTVSRGGKALIPVLGVGRAQEVMLVLEKARRAGKLENIPVFVQGMVWDVTAIHTAYPDFLNNDVKKAIFHRDQNPFLSDLFKRVQSSKEQKYVLEEAGPCVILATSGMLTAGASVEYFKNLASNPKNSINFVNYQGEGSLGRIVQRGEKEVNVNQWGGPELLKINMEVNTIAGFSGHSGRKQLMDFISKLDPLPKKVLTNHGDSSKCLDLASSIHKVNRIETMAPKNLEAVRLR